MTPQDNTPQPQSLAPVSDAVTMYLTRLDEHLATVPTPLRKWLKLDAERGSLNRIEAQRKLWEDSWSPNRGECPTRFSQLDIDELRGELAIRLVDTRKLIDI